MPGLQTVIVETSPHEFTGQDRRHPAGRYSEHPASAGARSSRRALGVRDRAMRHRLRARHGAGGSAGRHPSTARRRRIAKPGACSAMSTRFWPKAARAPACGARRPVLHLAGRGGRLSRDPARILQGQNPAIDLEPAPRVFPHAADDGGAGDGRGAGRGLRGPAPGPCRRLQGPSAPATALRSAQAISASFQARPPKRSMKRSQASIRRRGAAAACGRERRSSSRPISSSGGSSRRRSRPWARTSTLW